jgi:hypothetical protein
LVLVVQLIQIHRQPVEADLILYSQLSLQLAVVVVAAAT